MKHSVRLNPRNCKEMVVNFMGNPNTIMRPLYIGNQMVERISSYKLLGVIINGNLKWNCHVDYIVPLRHQRNCTLSDYLSELACKNKTCWKWPYSSYSKALSLANETTLSNRRELLCHKFMAEMTDNRDHPLYCSAWCPLLYKELNLITLDLGRENAFERKIKKPRLNLTPG